MRSVLCALRSAQAMALTNEAIILISHPTPSHSPPSHYQTLPFLSSSTSPKNHTKIFKASSPTFRASAITGHRQLSTARKTNYYPSLWNWDDMQSLTNGFDDYEYMKEIEKMKGEVKVLIESNQEDTLAKLELINVIRQLGLHYHFEAELRHALDIIHKRAEESRLSGDLYATSLRFRLLRQHGYYVPQDVFKTFLNETGNFRESLGENVEGMISLYEASFLGMKGEHIIDKAMEFSRACLDMKKNNVAESLAVKFDRALSMPVHWRPIRLQARWFIDAYENEPDMNPALLKLAKLDYNIVQSIHMKEIEKLVRWWVDLDMTKMRFSRDALMEFYMFSTLMLFEPKYEAFRLMNAKIATIITLMDDVYDAYGSLEELELLTDFITRWDITEIDKLPHTIMVCFMVLYNTTNEIGHQMMMDRGVDIIPYLREVWADQCKGYLEEKKWRHKPLITLNEYLDTAVTTIGGLIMQLWCFIATAETLTTDLLDSFSEIPKVMFSSALILRLVNDLATSLYGCVEGDNAKAVECYMNETRGSEEAARDHIEKLVLEAWKTMNEDMVDRNHPLISLTFVNACLDHARASQYFYQYGNGHDFLREGTRDDLISLFIQPVPMD